MEIRKLKAGSAALGVILSNTKNQFFRLSIQNHKELCQINKLIKKKQLPMKNPNSSNN